MALKKIWKEGKRRAKGIALFLIILLCGNFHRLSTLTGYEYLPKARDFPQEQASFVGGNNDADALSHDRHRGDQIERVDEIDDKRIDSANGGAFVSSGKKINIYHMDGSAALPACRPHFNLALPNNQWSNSTKFKRIYFYHARKAGGTSFVKYLTKVSLHYGLEFKAMEFGAMEEPGTYNDSATFYVTHLREPVSRSISHFKYQGRWECRDLVHNKTFAPTEENANKLETWNQTGGHVPFKCNNPNRRFFLSRCAVNCFVQWFAGSCPQWGISLDQQYHVARARVLKYNFVAVIDKFSDPSYVKSIERFFGVPGLQTRAYPFCDLESHTANKNVPLIVHNDTLERLEVLNALDRQLYHELSNCLESSTLDFPKWNPNRFELHTYNRTERKKNPYA